MAEASDRQTREIAHCGYLTFIAADQAYRAGVDKERIDIVIGDLVDFSAIFASLTERENLDQPAQITPELVTHMTTMGQQVHSARVRSMSPENALRLSNNLLHECREDLHILGMKLGTK